MISFPILWENCQFNMICIVDPLTSRTNEHVWLVCVHLSKISQFAELHNASEPFPASPWKWWDQVKIRWERWKPGPSGEKGGEVTCASSAPPEACPTSSVAPPPASSPSLFEQLLARSMMKCMRKKFRIECMLKIWSDLLLLYHQAYSSALHWPLEHCLKGFLKV